MRSDRKEHVVSRRLAVLAPLIFMAHVIEEALGFVSWFNRLVEPDITTSSFLTVNAVALLVTVLVAAAMAGSIDVVAGFVALGWFGFLFLANAILHLVGSVVHGYSPGTVTAVLLYVPFFVVLFRHVARHGAVAAAAVVSAVGALPMLVHGYLILFRGSRLF